MFFIYLFFGIGVLSTILALLPTIVEVVIYFISIFANFGTEKENRIELRKAKLNKKQEKKLAKINGTEAEVETPIEEVEVKVEEVATETTDTNNTDTTITE